MTTPLARHHLIRLLSLECLLYGPAPGVDGAFEVVLSQSLALWGSCHPRRVPLWPQRREGASGAVHGVATCDPAAWGEVRFERSPGMARSPARSNSAGTMVARCGAPLRRIGWPSRRCAADGRSGRRWIMTAGGAFCSARLSFYKHPHTLYACSPEYLRPVRRVMKRLRQVLSGKMLTPVEFHPPIGAIADVIHHAGIGHPTPAAPLPIVPSQFV